MIDETHIDNQKSLLSNGVSTHTENHQSEAENNVSQIHFKMMVEISSDSKIQRQIFNVIRKHFLEHKSINWKPIRVELIVNTQLTDEFFAIRKRFEKASAGNRCEFEEHYGFLIDNEQRVTEICQHGYQAIETSFNVLGLSRCGIYICKYADVCIRHASVRRTSESNTELKMILFKIVEGKQTAALVRKGPKLQPIAPTPQFTSHCSVIPPKESDDLEKQFDQSQIYLYDFEGRETVKRPPHCLPYAVVSLIEDSGEWPSTFDDTDIETDILETDVLRVIALSDDPKLQSILKENQDLAEVATRAFEHVYEEEPAASAVQESRISPPIKTSNESMNGSTTVTEMDHNATTNGIEISSSLPRKATDSVPPSSTSPVPASSANDELDSSPIGLSVPPPPPLTALGTNNKIPATAVATTIPLAHTAAAIQAAYRQQTGLLGALPAMGGLRAVSGGVYAAANTLTNGLSTPLICGGIPLDGYRTFAAGAVSPYVLAASAGQAIQQPGLYAAHLPGMTAQQQAAQLVAAAAQQQQQQQQALISGIPAGCMVVRTANGGYALLAQTPGPTAAALQPTAAQPQLVQQQYIALNAAGQATIAGGRVPMAIVGGQAQPMVYQYAGQPALQAGSAQYIQLPGSYGQSPTHQALSTGPIMQAGGTAAIYSNQTPTQYIGTSQSNSAATTGTATSNGNAVISAVATASQVQNTPTIISPQKQSAATATAAALQQQQQYQHVKSSSQQQQQHQVQQSAVNGAHGTSMYYAAVSQNQVQQPTVAAANLAQQQQQLNLISQIQYAHQQGIPQQMLYATPNGQAIYQAGGQSYVLTQAGSAGANSTTTGAPVVYSAGPALHNNPNQQTNQHQSTHSQAQIAYQMINPSSNINLSASPQSTAGAGVVAQQPAQLVQRASVVPQVRHHPYRN